MPSLKATFFKTPADFRKWLQKNHTTALELIVGYYKVDSGKPSITWPQSVDQALCFGWIDGIRRSIDTDSYCIRFTPRRPNSLWSAVNIKKMKELQEAGLMTPAGLAVFTNRNPAKTYSYENKETVLDKKLESAFKKNKKAFTYFSTQTKSYQKTAIHWVMSSPKQETREKRMLTLILDCEAGQKIKPLSYGSKK